MKNSFLLKFIFITSILVSYSFTLAQEATPPAPAPKGNAYTLLEPGIFGRDKVVIGGETTFGDYASMAFKSLLAIAVALAVIQIVLGGFAYVTSAIPGVKSDAKGKITAALTGLALLLFSWLILNTINPDLVNWKLKLDPLTSNQNKSLSTHLSLNR